MASTLLPRLADRLPQWLSWLVLIQVASGSSRVAAARLVGKIGGPSVPFARTRMIAGFRFWQWKAKEGCASTTASPGAAT